MQVDSHAQNSDYSFSTHRQTVGLNWDIGILRSISDIMSAMTRGTDDWDLLAPTSIMSPPFQLLFGHAAQLHSALQKKKNAPKYNHDDYESDSRNRMHVAHQTARTKSNIRSKVDYDSKAIEICTQVGDRVFLLLYDESVRQRSRSKNCPRHGLVSTRQLLATE